MQPIKVPVWFTTPRRNVADHIFTLSVAQEIRSKTMSTIIIRSRNVMENLWITTAEVAVQPGDMPSGDTLGFMRITMWASSKEDFVHKLKEYLAKYQWNLISMENTEVVDPSRDYGDE